MVLRVYSYQREGRRAAVFERNLDLDASEGRRSRFCSFFVPTVTQFAFTLSLSLQEGLILLGVWMRAADSLPPSCLWPVYSFNDAFNPLGWCTCLQVPSWRESCQQLPVAWGVRRMVRSSTETQTNKLTWTTALKGGGLGLRLRGSSCSSWDGRPAQACLGLQA